VGRFPGLEEKDNVSNFPLGREVGEMEDSVEEVGVEYDERSRCPSTIKTTENVENFRELIHKDRR
jgi:hypothetical protein